MMTAEERIAKNSERCSANKYLEFKGAVRVDAKDRWGNDYSRLDLLFSDYIDIKLFSPAKSNRDRGLQSIKLTCLAASLGRDFMDIPACQGGWEEFVEEVCSLINPKKGNMIYAKVTVNESGWIELGEGKCFSVDPDMEYTDADMRFLTDVAIKAPNTSIGHHNLPYQEEVTLKPKTKTKKILNMKIDDLGKMEDPMSRARPEVIIEDTRPFPSDALILLPGENAEDVQAGLDKIVYETASTPKAQDPSKDTSAFDEYLEENTKPAWVEEEVEKHAPKARKTRVSKKKPGVSIVPEIGDPADGGEGIGFEDLPY